MSFVLAYASALGSLIVFDALWLSSMKNFYRREMGALMRPKPKAVPVVAFYIVYAAVMVVLCVSPRSTSSATVFLHGAALGLAAYGTYNLTNLAVVPAWPLRSSLVDWTWGMLLSGVAAAIAHRAVS